MAVKLAVLWMEEGSGKGGGALFLSVLEVEKIIQDQGVATCRSFHTLIVVKK